MLADNKVAPAEGGDDDGAEEQPGVSPLSRILADNTVAPAEGGDDDDAKEQLGADPSPPLWPILVLQFGYFFAIGLSIPVYPEVMTGTAYAAGDAIVGGTLFSLSITANAVCEFLSASFLGELSDSMGRRPLLMLSCLGQALDFLIAAAAARDSDYTFQFENATFRAVIAARAVAGFCGNCMIFTRAATADVVSHADAAFAFGKLSACIGVAMILGPGLGGLLYTSTQKHRVPLLLASSINILNMLFVKFYMKESLRPAYRTKFSWKNANPVGMVRFLLTRRFLKFFAAMSFVDSLSLQFFLGIMAPYVVYAYQATVGQIAQMMVVFGLGLIFSMAVVMKITVRKWGEIRTLQLGYMITCTAYLLFALCYWAGATPQAKWVDNEDGAFNSTSVETTTRAVHDVDTSTRVEGDEGDTNPLGLILMFPTILYFTFGFISQPTQLSIASRCVTNIEQGKLQGANGSLDTIGKIVGPLLAAAIFKPSVDAGMPTLVFFVVAILVLPGVYVAFTVRSYLPPGYMGTTFRDTVPESEAHASP